MQIDFKGKTLNTSGQVLTKGATLPPFELVNAAAKSISRADLTGKLTLISVVPDINTSVCSISTKHFNAEADKFPEVNFFTISTNTIADQKNWCAVEGVQRMQLLSDAAHQFGLAMGLYVPELGIDARSIWILDAEGQIIYQELIKVQTNEPNYQAALDFLKTR